MRESFFPVKEAEVIYDTPTGDIHTGYKLIVREDTNKILSCMTNEYSLITNEQVMNKALPTLEKKKAELIECKMFGDGARTQWKFRIPKVKVKIAEGDYVNPEIIIKNSYDGTSEVSAYGGAFRLVCSNGLVIGYAIGHDKGIRHIGSNSDDDVERIIDSIINQVTGIFDEDFPRLVETKLHKPHIGAIVKLFPETVMKDVVNQLLMSNPKNYWDLLNAATFIATHKMKRNNESTHKLENKIYPTIKNLVSSIAEA